MHAAQPATRAPSCRRNAPSFSHFETLLEHAQTYSLRWGVEMFPRFCPCSGIRRQRACLSVCFFSETADRSDPATAERSVSVPHHPTVDVDPFGRNNWLCCGALLTLMRSGGLIRCLSVFQQQPQPRQRRSDHSKRKGISKVDRFSHSKKPRQNTRSQADTPPGFALRLTTQSQHPDTDSAHHNSNPARDRQLVRGTGSVFVQVQLRIRAREGT